MDLFHNALHFNLTLIYTKPTQYQSILGCHGQVVTYFQQYYMPKKKEIMLARSVIILCVRQISVEIQFCPLTTRQQLISLIFVGKENSACTTCSCVNAYLKQAKMPHHERMQITTEYLLVNINIGCGNISMMNVPSCNHVSAQCKHTYV